MQAYVSPWWSFLSFFLSFVGIANFPFLQKLEAWWPQFWCFAAVFLHWFVILFLLPSGEICAFKIYGQDAPFEAVVLNRTSGVGVLRASSPVDCESQKEYTFIIQAYDCGAGPGGANWKKSHKWVNPAISMFSGAFERSAPIVSLQRLFMACQRENKGEWYSPCGLCCLKRHLWRWKLSKCILKLSHRANCYLSLIIHGLQSKHLLCKVGRGNKC